MFLDILRKQVNVYPSRFYNNIFYCCQVFSFKRNVSADKQELFYYKTWAKLEF
jgi:hypothetical protein